MNDLEGELQALSLRPKQAAAALGISQRTLQELTKRGEIPSVSIGTGKRAMRLYPVSELRAWLKEKSGVVSIDGDFFLRLCEVLKALRAHECAPEVVDRTLTARCPVHDDDKRCLKVTLRPDHSIRFRCECGCAEESIRAELGLKPTDLLPTAAELLASDR